VKVRRGGVAEDYGPTDGRDWLTVLPFETCDRGHEMTVENVLIVGKYKQCRLCKERANRKRVECPVCHVEVLAANRARHVERVHRRPYQEATA